MSQKLVAAADCQDSAAVLHISVKAFLYFFQFASDQHLFPVRASAQKDDVQTGEINGVS